MDEQNGKVKLSPRQLATLYYMWESQGKSAVRCMFSSRRHSGFGAPTMRVLKRHGFVRSDFGTRDTWWRITSSGAALSALRTVAASPGRSFSADQLGVGITAMNKLKLCGLVTTGRRRGVSVYRASVSGVGGGYDE